MIRKPKSNGQIKPVTVSPMQSDFTEEEVMIGEQISSELPSTVIQILAIGKKLSAAHASMVNRGRDSLWKRYCEVFALAVEQKTIDRWRKSYDKFAAIAQDESGQFCPSILNMRLTALYRLSRDDASDKDRDAALAVAKSGKLVTEKLATELIKGTAPITKSDGQETYRTKVKLPSGSIVVSINHSDFREALEEALRELSKQEEQVASQERPYSVGPETDAS